eukprot:CAMPEP_0172153382 /NCGR_PEP_ID=MMETSP1050-20130122/1407_1 /TAXON_ID=233186 /ORGANISM="Cryptomonas curvata, Strain CCAP979/52" /LENGTH=121 /DNA_ID=CAMNT_0012821899 /DNA_START=133 /DNA_END=495 /DNA_ORIENTATION=+
METLLRELDDDMTDRAQNSTQPPAEKRSEPLYLNDSQQLRLGAQINAIRLIQQGSHVPANLMVEAGGQLEDISWARSPYAVPPDRGGREDWFRRAARPEFWALPDHIVRDLARGGDLSAIY